MRLRRGRETERRVRESKGKRGRGKDDCWSLGGSTPVIVADECLYIFEGYVFGNCSLPISSNSTTLKSCR